MKSDLRILHIIIGLSTGGAERALFNLLSGGLAESFECAVLSLTDEGTMGAPIRALGVPIETLGMRAGLTGPGVLIRLRQQVRAFRPDLIQGWMYHGNLAASLAARLAPGQPALVWNIRQCLDDLGKEKWLTRQVIRANRAISGRTNTIIYNSYLSRDQHEAFGYDRARGVVIPNGFSPDRMTPDPKAAEEVRHEFSLPEAAPIVGHVARFHPIKDHATFLRAAVEVARRVPEARFLLVGREVTPDNPALAGLVPPDLMARFIFTGERQDVPRLMQAMEVFCLSSLSEAFPNVLGEAMACAVPCVTTDVGDSATIVGETGLVVPPSDSAALVRALTDMLERPSGERRVLGLAGRDRIAEHYCLDAIAERYARLYEGMTRQADD